MIFEYEFEFNDPFEYDIDDDDIVKFLKEEYQLDIYDIWDFHEKFKTSIRQFYLDQIRDYFYREAREAYYDAQMKKRDPHSYHGVNPDDFH